MKYLNQLDHPDIPYPTDAATEGSRFHDLSIKEAGCGLCSLAMMVDRLTTKTISLKRLIALSLKHKANLHPGTDMKILGPVVADLYDLDFSTTNSVKKAMQHLKNGGSVIANVGGDREGYTGVFSHGGHYVLLLSAGKALFCSFGAKPAPRNWRCSAARCRRLPAESAARCPSAPRHILQTSAAAWCADALV